MGDLIHLSNYREPDFEEKVPEKGDYLQSDSALKSLDDALREHEETDEKCLSAFIYSALGAGGAFVVSAIISDNAKFYDYALACGVVEFVFMGLYLLHKRTGYKGEYRRMIKNKDILED